MSTHSVASSHAHRMTARLLNAVIDASDFPVRVAEIEGDAVFFYASAEGSRRADTVVSLKRQLIAVFRAFHDEVARLKAMDVCSCEACSSVGTLRLKEVVHSERQRSSE